jgi:hypothetical protein
MARTLRMALANVTPIGHDANADHAKGANSHELPSPHVLSYRLHLGDVVLNAGNTAFDGSAFLSVTR